MAMFLEVWPAAVRQVVRGGFARKIIAKIIPDTEVIKIHPYMSVVKLSLLVNIQQKVGELASFHNFLSLNNYFIKYFK
jgi:hypothetical protein